jgi:hypothetical protein
MGNKPARVGVASEHDADNEHAVRTRIPEPEPIDVSVVEKGVSWAAAATDMVASFDVPPEAAELFSRVAASDGPRLGKVLLSLASGAADILSSLKPAASIAGPFLVVAELALSQLVKWHDAHIACGALRDSVSSLTPIVLKFGSSKDLSREFAKLLIAATK